MKKTRMDSDRKWKVCLMKVPLFLLKNACGASYKPFYIFFVVPLWGHFSKGILTKTKKRKVKCLYFRELQQERHVHNKFLIFSFFQPTLVFVNPIITSKQGKITWKATKKIKTSWGWAVPSSAELGLEPLALNFALAGAAYSASCT